MWHFEIFIYNHMLDSGRRHSDFWLSRTNKLQSDASAFFTINLWVNKVFRGIQHFPNDFLCSNPLSKVIIFLQFSTWYLPGSSISNYFIINFLVRWSFDFREENFCGYQIEKKYTYLYSGRVKADVLTQFNYCTFIEMWWLSSVFCHVLWHDSFSSKSIFHGN